MLRRCLVAASLALFASGAHAQQAPVQWGDILIYQAEVLDEVMPDEHALGEYIDRLQAVLEREALADTSARSAGVLFVALAPDGRHRVWLLDTTSLSPQARDRWEAAVSAAPGIPTPGYFLFGLSFGVGVPAHQSDGVPPIPAEWEAQIPAGGAMLDNAFIGRVWPRSR